MGYFQPIQFTKTFLKDGNSDWREPQVTSVALGPDGKYYISTLTGVVHVLTTDLGNRVRSKCESDNVGGRRSILGIAFNPAERGVKLYASTSVLHWGTYSILETSEGWRNGQVITMQKTAAHHCLAKTGNVVEHLPVSNYDHGVNGLAFDNSGRLMIAVGSATNAGVSDSALGGISDSPLSGSILYAPVLDAGFNGRVAYSQVSDPSTTRKTGGDVFLFAVGMRNPFCLVTHSNGHMYATEYVAILAIHVFHFFTRCDARCNAVRRFLLSVC